MKKEFNFLENEDEKQEKKNEAKDDKMGDDSSPAASDHSDEEQDKALFAKLIKQYLGKENPDETETEMAKQAYQAHKETGMSHEDAMEAAGKHLKMAAEIGKKMHQAMQSKSESEGEKEAEKNESEAHEDECKEESEKKEAEPSPDKLNPGKKESAAVIKLTAEVAKLRESVKVYELRDYLESKLKKSGESNTCTKLFREALGNPKSKQHIDDTWNTFIKAYKAGAEEVGSSDVLFMEKQSRNSAGSQKGSFEDCLDI